MIIAAPIAEHFPLARTALSAGADVYLEKPPVTSLDDFDRGWDIIGLFVLAVVIAVPAALFVLYIVGGYIINRHREECPSCHRRRLRLVQAWRW